MSACGCSGSHCRLVVGDVRHGSYNGYTNLGCRCGPCREANRQIHHRYMHADPIRLERHAARERRRYAANSGSAGASTSYRSEQANGAC